MSPAGYPTNAIYGMLKMMFTLLEENEVSHLLGVLITELGSNLIEYTKNGLAVAARYEGKDMLIVTFLGDKTWGRWWRERSRIRRSRKVVAVL